MSSWMSWPFKNPKLETDAQPLTAMNKLNETREMLEEQEKAVKRKASQEVEKANEFIKAKDKRAAIQCLKRRRLHEQQIERLGGFELRIDDQMIMLEGGRATTETVDALRTGAAAMKAMNIDDVDNIMYGINEQCEAMKQMQVAVSAPFPAVADSDEDELEAELEALEGAELEELLPLPAETVSSAPFRVPVGLLPAPPVRQGIARDDELEGTELEEQVLLPAATASAAPEHVIAGLLPAPPASQGSD